MTVVFTAASERLVVMAADSAVQLDFGETREYETGRKLWWLSGVGGVSAWGARDGNPIWRFLDREWAAADGRDIERLARDVHRYLVSEFSPDVDQRPDCGFHIAGFTADRQPRLFHSYWNMPRDAQSKGSYSFQVVTPPPPTVNMVFNGRNDLAERVIGGLLEDLKAGKDTRFTPRAPGGLVYLAHMILRFAGEISQEVSPPFFIRAVAHNGAEVQFKYDSLDRVDIAQFDAECAKF